MIFRQAKIAEIYVKIALENSMLGAPEIWKEPTKFSEFQQNSCHSSTIPASWRSGFRQWAGG
jgi:hypothetical protein